MAWPKAFITWFKKRFHVTASYKPSLVYILAVMGEPKFLAIIIMHVLLIFAGPFLHFHVNKKL